MTVVYVTVVALILSLAQDLPYATSAVLNGKRKKKKRKRDKYHVSFICGI